MKLKNFNNIMRIIVAIGLFFGFLLNLSDWIVAIYVGMACGIILADIILLKFFDNLVDQHESLNERMIDEVKELQTANNILKKNRDDK